MYGVQGEFTFLTIVALHNHQYSVLDLGMHLTTLLPALLSGLSLANAEDQLAPATWLATNFTLGCSASACAWSFNVTGARTENTPGFNTHCQGIVPNATLCADKSITAVVQQLHFPLWRVTVEHEWSVEEPQLNSEMTYWQSGSTNVTAHTKTFPIKPDSFYGVA